MKVAVAYPWVVTGWLLIALPRILIAEALPDASFRDWAGFVESVELRDGSKLFEYSAQSSPLDTAGSALSISFIPRFKCVPMLSVLVPADDLDEDSVLSIEVYLGSEPFIYNGFRDTNGDKQVYSIAAPADKLIALREKLDVSSTVRVRVLTENVQSADTQTTVADSAFSLFGSAMSTKATELHCQRHSPQDYQ